MTQVSWDGGSSHIRFRAPKSKPTRRLASVIVASALILGAAETSFAQGAGWSSFAQRDVVVTSGAAAMLRLHIPFGGSSTPESQTTFAMSVGPSWRLSAEFTVTPQYHFMPMAEVGFTFRGDPVLRVGAIDVVQSIADHASAQSEGQSDRSVDTRAVWIVLGVIAVGTITALLVLSDDDDEICKPSLPPQCP